MNEDYRNHILKTAMNTLDWTASRLDSMLRGERPTTEDAIDILIYDLERAYENLGQVLINLRTLVGRSEELKADPREM